ncbi:hypothetical protein CK203_096833 [Vitis vinifera]|uniref:Uncharacterized protein n=1 Tax=Vitis vinifera TaxID=29760 RepID=A0A438EJV5_VITVI|nr:hypothetical protein CK203_096833 [Vitis vinifera]
MPTEKGEENVILFTKEQFNAGLRFPLPALFKEFLHFSQIPPIFIHPNLVRVLMGCSIINMLYSLDLTLLEVFFVYSLKKAKNDIFSVSAHLPSLQMVTELPDSTKGGAKGLVASGVDGRGYRSMRRGLFLQLYLKNSGFGIEGPPCGLGGKGVLRLKLAKDEIVPGEHYTVKELPLYQEAKEADAERRRKLLEDRDQKKMKALSGRLPDRSGVRTLLQRKLQEKGEAGEEAWEGCEGTHSSQGVSSSKTYEGEVMIEEPVNAAPHSISSGPGRMSGLNPFGPSLGLRVWLTGGRKPKSAFRRPGSLGHSPGERASSKKPRLTRDLRPDSWRLQERQQEIEISCASAHDAHPDGGEVEMATETSAAPAIIPAEMHPDRCVRTKMWGSDSGQESFCSSSEEELLTMPLLLALSATRSWNMIYVFAFLVCVSAGEGPPRMAQQHDLFTQLLQTADYMRTFSSRPRD